MGPGRPCRPCHAVIIIHSPSPSAIMTTATEGMDIGAFVAKQKDLLQLELRSEQGEESQVAGTGRRQDSSSSEERPQNVLRGLRVESVTVGLYGRTVVHLESGSSVPAATSSSADVSGSGISGDSEEPSASAPTVRAGAGGTGSLLPSHRLTVGDEVEILGRNGSSSSDRKRNAGGVICALDDATISIALFGQKRASTTTTNGADGSDDSGDDFGLGVGSPPFTVVPKSSAAVHRKMIDALDELSKAGADHDQAGAIIGAVFGGVDGDTRTTSTGQANPGSNISVKRRYNGDLDVSQDEAIDFTLGGGSVGLIHGPPGI